MESLRGFTAIITGATGGVGGAIAQNCAENGINLALVGRDESRLISLAQHVRKQGVSVIICIADVVEEDQIRKAVEKTNIELGDVSILINNTGVNFKNRNIEDTSLSMWDQIFSVNLRSAFLFTQMILPIMKKNRCGTIINISSRVGIYPKEKSGVAYSASKMGLEALNQITNENANEYNVRSTIICPGSINTAFLNKRPSPPNEEVRSKYIQPNDIANTVDYILSLPQNVVVEKIILKSIIQL